MNVDIPATIGNGVRKTAALPTVVFCQYIIPYEAAVFPPSVIPAKPGQPQVPCQIPPLVAVLQPVEIAEVQPQQLVADSFLLPEIVHIRGVFDPPLPRVEASGQPMEIASLRQMNRPIRRGKCHRLSGVLRVIAQDLLCAD